MTATGLFPGPRGWRLTPEGAAVHVGEKTAVVADVHLGYEWARARGGDCIPEHSLSQTIARLKRLIDRATIRRLVVAGDLVESRRPCPRTASDVDTLIRWLAERGIELIPLAGNHDPPCSPPLPSTVKVGNWTVGHGHEPIPSSRTVSGHHHPVLRIDGLSAPCFLVGPSAIVLPAFSGNAAGVALGTLDPSVAVCRPGGPLRCVAAAGEALLDFGPVPELLRMTGHYRRP
jgi:putative SbcD/Mre11-related phosphoesterase